MLEPKDAQRYERELRAMLRRAGDEDPEGFAQVVQLLTQAVNALPIAAQLNRVQHGYSWAELAGGLGWSRQHAQQQLGRKLDPAAKDLDAAQLHELLRQQIGLYEAPASEGVKWDHVRGTYVDRPVPGQLDVETARRVEDVREFYGDEAAQLVAEGWTVDGAANHVQGVCDVTICMHPDHQPVDA